MALLSRVRSLLRNLLRHRRVDEDLDAEVRAYLELLTDEKRAAGLPDDAARRAALVELQGVEQVKEHVRGTRAGAAIDCWRQDARYAARMFVRDRRFTAAAVLTLALGIGVHTAVFTVVDTALLRPLPYADAARLVKIWCRPASQPIDDVSLPDFLDLQAQGKAFEQLAADDGSGYVVEYAGWRETVNAAIVTDTWLPTLGVRPVLGRAFVHDD